MQQAVDRERARAFATQLFGYYKGAILSYLVKVGYRTGLFEAAARGPATSQALAERAGLEERYVREWLGAMVTGGIFDYEAASRTYTLPPEHAACLTGGHAANVAPSSVVVAHLGTHLAETERVFQEGGGVPYSVFRPEFTAAMDDSWRRIYDELLVDGFLAATPGICERLERGARVADVGCGTGHAINLMARAYPRSTFVGYDLAEDAIARARAEANEMGLANASFVVLDVTQLPAEPALDLITAFDSIHDQVDPAAVLRRVGEALAPDGTFLMIDFKFSSNLEDNIANPFAPFYYGTSLLHCMTVSLAEGGAGLGAVWGEQLARRMLAEAGFTSVVVLDSPRPQNCIYVCRK